MSLVSSLVIPAGVSGELLGRCVLGFGGKCATDLIEERVLEPLIAECCIWSLRQEHGAGIVRVDSIPVEMKEGARPVYPDAADGWFLHLDKLQGSKAGFAVRTADCLPIILLGTRYIALLHAGWRGLQSGIIGAALQMFQSEAESIRCVALGPSADPSLYEVGEEFEEYFGESGAVAIVNGKRTFDLHREAKFQLEKAQYQGPIDEVSCCTMSDSSYYSHRCNPEGRRRNYTVAIFL